MSDKWTSARLISDYATELKQLHAAGHGRRGAAKIIEEETGRGCSPAVVRMAFNMMGLEASGRTADVPVVDRSPSIEDGEPPIEELIEERRKAARRKSARANVHRRHLELPAEPLGILVMGDPHVDNEGCDWDALASHVELAQQTEGVMGVCVGDLQDNWIGRLAKLYAKSSVRASSGWRLSEWLLESIQWLALVGGNHDEWSHAAGHDPLKWISEKANVLCYAPDEIRLTLTWKDRSDLEPIVWLIRHDFSGRSWFHPTHGPHKEAMLDGECHVLAAGHLHQWGLLMTEQRRERVTYALRARGYKRQDDFARSKGFFEQSFGESALVILDPHATATGKIQVFWDLELGCKILTHLREQHNGS